MEKERMGEIALALLRYYIRTEGYRVPPQIKRQLENLSRAIRIPQNELIEFGKKLFDELITSEVFGK